MPFSYNNLWKLLIDKGLTKEELRVKANLSPNTISAMGKNKSVSLDVIDKICTVLDCEPYDIFEYKKLND